MLNCLIIEDEPLAAEILQDYIHDVPNLKLVATCRDVISASAYLRSHQVDVLFVDIHLPKINGIEFIKTIQNQYQIILTTAYHQYAMDGYDLNVVDYLLKPIEFSRFLQAINKIKSTDAPKQLNPEDSTNTELFHFYNVDKRQVKIYNKDILFIESIKEYVKIHTVDQTVVTKAQIGDLETLMDANQFIRIHKSYVVNINSISAYSASQIEIGKIILPIGRTYKELVTQKILKIS